MFRIRAFASRRCFSAISRRSLDRKSGYPAITWGRCTQLWLNSLRPTRLQTLQNKLIEEMLPKKFNDDLERIQKQILLDEHGNFINEVEISRKSLKGKPIKHIVFIHGYGASLGCFARNFELIDYLKDSRYDYRIHFLDNITFGLSSNPGLNSKLLKNGIPRCPNVKLYDDTPGQHTNIYNRYYKLIDHFEIDVQEFKEYQSTFKQILDELDEFYTSAIENWRKASNINKIACLAGHSFGAYWSSVYSIKYPSNVEHLLLLSPVGVERHIHAVNAPIKEYIGKVKPSIDPVSYKFLSRLPLLSKMHIFLWYNLLPVLPGIIKLLGPFGVRYFYKMRFPKLFKVNKVIQKLGGHQKLDEDPNNIAIGSYEESFMIFEYLYNAISNGSKSDTYIKCLLTPATVSKMPLYDRFSDYFSKAQPQSQFDIDIIYGEYDFMNSEAGEKMIQHIKALSRGSCLIRSHSIKEGGHNFYLDNPFDTNELLSKIIKIQD